MTEASVITMSLSGTSSYIRVAVCTTSDRNVQHVLPCTWTYNIMINTYRTVLVT